MKRHIRLRRRATSTERISSFVDHLLQPTAQIQKLYLKDTTDSLNFIEKTKVAKETILVSMDVTSLYTNIPQEERISVVCKTYKLPNPSHFLGEMLRIIFKETSFHFNRKNHLQTHGTPMGTKWQYLLLTSLWWKLRLISSTKALINHSFGKDTLTTSFLDGT